MNLNSKHYVLKLYDLLLIDQFYPENIEYNKYEFLRVSPININRIVKIIEYLSEIISIKHNNLSLIDILDYIEKTDQKNIPFIQIYHRENLLSHSFLTFLVTVAYYLANYNVTDLELLKMSFISLFHDIGKIRM